MTTTRPKTDFATCIDFHLIHPLTVRGPGAYFKVRGLILKVIRKHEGTDFPLWEVWDVVARTPSEFFRASTRSGFVGRKHAWAAQAYARAHGLLLPKGGKA
jgi:hypothetical protein